MRAAPLFALLAAAACSSSTETPANDRDAAAPAVDAAPSSPDAALAEDAAPDAAAPDAAAPDAAEAEDAGAPDAVLSPVTPARYAFDRDHSPLTRSVVDHLRAIRARNTTGADNVFAKVGDSITEATSFLRCFGGTRYDLAGRDLQTTRDHFAAGDAAGTDPFRRDSLAAVVGWSAWAPLRGTPPPLDQELDAIHPDFAVVMFGTNDIDTMNLVFYGENMMALVDALLARNVIPILSSIPPRADSAGADADVPRYALVARALAEARQLPFIDLERRMRMLNGFGLGPDGVHPNADSRGACILDAAGIEHGYNLRNLLVLEGLDRVRRTVLAGEDALDPDDPPRAGSGTAADPYTIDVLPFTDARDTSQSSERKIDQYACAPQDESGPEVYYHLHLDAPAHLHAWVIDQGSVDIDLHHLAGGTGGDACDARNDRELILDLGAGEHDFVLDTFAGDAQAGEYLFVLRQE